MPPIIVIAGPTASGKSKLAVEMAAALGGGVVNADSMQVYRELRVLTARPGPEDEQRAPHRLYGVLPAWERCSAARWREMALAALGEGAARPAVVCGGTGFYIEALLHGLSDMPETAPGVEAAARARRETLGAAGFHREVAARDPELARRVPPGDRQRLLRAWALFEATGRPLSEWQAGPRPAPLSAWTVLLDPPRERLNARIEERFRTMLASGALEEADRLRGLDPDLPAMKALGLPELHAHLAGKIALDEAESRAVHATRRFAKRQRTWFRNRLRPDAVFRQDYSPELPAAAMAALPQDIRGPRQPAGKPFPRRRIGPPAC